MANAWGVSWGSSWGVSWGTAQTPVTVAGGRRSAATSYSRRTLGSIRREKERELKKLAKLAKQAKVEKAPEAEPTVSVLFTPEIQSAYYRAEMLREHLLKLEMEDEDDIEALLLSA